jgi:hypothetical protein
VLLSASYLLVSRFFFLVSKTVILLKKALKPILSN